MKDNEVGRARKAVIKYEKSKKRVETARNISDKTRMCTHDYTGMLEIDRGPKINIEHKDKE